MLDDIAEWGDVCWTIGWAHQLIFGPFIIGLVIYHCLENNYMLGLSCLVLYVLFWLALFSFGVIFIFIKHIFNLNK